MTDNNKKDKAIKLDYLPCVNYVMLHNKQKIVNRCVVANNTDEDWKYVKLKMESDYFAPFECMLEDVNKHMEIEVGNFKIEPDLIKLLQLTESISVEFVLTLSVNNTEYESQKFPIMLMAFDQWSGLHVMPDSLAAFVVPNNPLISRVLNTAGPILKKLTGRAELDGYQTQNRNRVRAQVAAVYEALRAESINYTNPPASFAKSGQRIRLADKVLNEKLSTCIDTTLLYASCLEAMGIFPLIVLFNDHAFLGAWLTDDISFSHNMGDDDTYLLKQIADGVNNIVLVEATCITSSERVSFEDAVKRAENTLRVESDKFFGFLDIRHCRLSGILPLPQITLVNGEWQVVNEGVEHDNATKNIKYPDHFSMVLNEKEDTMSKQMLWERKLLDFSLRNTLINTRLGKRVIPFVSFNIDRLEDYLYDGSRFKILPTPGSKVLPSVSGMYDSKAQMEKFEEIVSKEIKNKNLYSYLTEGELRDSLKFLYKTSKSSLEESGANSLFLALGMLKWYETDKSELERFAPILLLPVELKRYSSLDYSLQSRDEDIILNITLVELLKQQFNIDLSVLSNLPKDEKGVDVKKIFSIIRQFIAKCDRWNVYEEALLGIFSFSKFVMWNDIHSNADKLIQNDVVNGLVNKSLVSAEQKDEISENRTRELDKKASPDTFAIPVDVDSSQMEAVIDSGEGKSFILYGPPGTGKSQTITNMIANALYKGKRVLFVAEKMAALEVVQRRLAKIGLDPFCLELHSNKVTKQHFLKQMEQALNTTRIKNPEDFKSKAQQLFDERKKLIGNMEAIHMKRESGYSLYECISRFLSISEEEIPNAVLPEKAMKREGLAEYEDMIRSIQPVMNVTGHPSSHPLMGLFPFTVDSVARQNIVDLLLEMKKYAVSLMKEERVVFGGMNMLSEPQFSKDDLQLKYDICKALASMPLFSAEIYDITNYKAKTDELQALIPVGRSLQKLKASLLNDYFDSVLTLDGERLKKEWEEVKDKFFLFRFFAKRSFVGKLKTYKKSKMGADEVDSLLDILIECGKLEKEYKSSSIDVASLFSTLGKKDHEDWDKIQAVLDNSLRLHDALSKYSISHDLSYPQVVDGLMASVGGNWDMYLQQKGGSVGGFVDFYEKINAVLEKLGKHADVVMTTENVGESWEKTLNRWIDNMDTYSDWCQWSVRRKQLNDSGLKSVVEYIEGGKMPIVAAESFVKSVMHRLVTKIVDSDASLRMFNGVIFEDTIEKYRKFAKDFQDLTKRELYCRLAANIPSQTIEPAANTEMGILKRNIKSNGRGTSIRAIIDQIPNLLPRLAPCMLMSPISVAQFLSLDNEKFDIVVFDEASQMPTSEAVGAIARGKALAVVGDPKQMPPTSFFTSSQTDDEEADIDDLESILDDCISLSMPAHHLSWHYRSKHESLIAFSNTQYYDGKLFTFPSVDDRKTKVSLVKIQGEYDRSKSRTNKAEAKAVADEVIRRLRDPELSKYSIGIVAFSKAQQSVIEDLLYEQLDKDVELKNMAENVEEPLFIKNLENVQGDERDVILFSVGYGPDKNGHVSMNFGPLNNAGGERRLNVAVSRSRYEMIVFSSLLASHIDLNRTNAVGVAGLKKFLEYAEFGSQSMRSTKKPENNEARLVEIIAGELTDLGYKVDTFVGRSDFKVDIAVQNPENEDAYVLGILCDGENYYATNTTRDREICQPSVLKMLHWNVMRVWAVDWYEHKEQVIERIKKNIDNALHPQKSKEKPKPEAADNVSSGIANFGFKVDEGDIIAQDTNSIETQYVFAKVSGDLCRGKIENFIKSIRLNEVIRIILETEQPITNKLLNKRIAALFPQQKLTPTMVKAIERVLVTYPGEPTSEDGIFSFWANLKVKQNFKVYRVNSEREILEIPIIEFENAALYDVEQQISIKDSDLRKQIAGQLGFPRMGARIEEVTGYVISKLVAEGKLLSDSNNYLTRP